MKKLCYLSLVVLATVFGCKKDQLSLVDPDGTDHRLTVPVEEMFEVRDGLCEITDIDDFEALLGDTLFDSLSYVVVNLLQQAPDYISYSEVVFTDDYLSNLSEEDRIAAENDQNSIGFNMLNHDKVVKFGDYYVLSDIENELLYIRKDDDPGAYTDLVNNPGNAPNITLDYGDDLAEVIAYLKDHGDVWDDEDFQDNYGQRGACPAAPGKIAQSNWTYLYETPNVGCQGCTAKYYIYILVRYRNYGVYGHAFAQTAMQNCNFPVSGGSSCVAWSEEKIIDMEPWKVKPKCKSWIGPYSTDYVDAYGCWNNACEFKKTFYNATKKLEEYYLKGRANMHPVGSTPWTAYKVVSH